MNTAFYFEKLNSENDALSFYVVLDFKKIAVFEYGTYKGI